MQSILSPFSNTHVTGIFDGPWFSFSSLFTLFWANTKINHIICLRIDHFVILVFVSYIVLLTRVSYCILLLPVTRLVKQFKIYANTLACIIRYLRGKGDLEGKEQHEGRGRGSGEKWGEDSGAGYNRRSLMFFVFRFVLGLLHIKLLCFALLCFVFTCRIV